MKDPLVPAQTTSIIPAETLVPDKQYYHAVTAVPIDEASDLQVFLAFLRRRLWFVFGVSVLTMTVLGFRVLTQPPQYQGSFRILVEPVNNEADKIDQTLGVGRGYNYFGRGLDYPSQIEVLNSQSTLKPILQNIQQRYPGFTYGQLVGGMRIKNPDLTKILVVSYSAQDPEQVEFVLSKLSDGFIQYSIFERHTSLLRATELVDQQIIEQRKEVERLEQWIEQFRRQNDLFQPEDYARDLSDQLTAVLARQREIQAELAAAETLNARLQAQLGMNPSEAVVVSTLSEAPAYQELLTKLREIEAQIALQSAQFHDDSPMIQDLVEQRSRLIPLLADEAQRIVNRSQIAREGANVQTLGFQGSVGRDLGKQLVESANQVKILQAQNDALARTEQDLRQQTKAFAGAARSYEGVERNLTIANDSLSRLLEARETLQLDRTKQTNPWQLISDISQSSIFDASRKSRQLTLSAIASVLFGIVAAWLVDKLDQAYHKPEDMSQDLGLPCLGQIPINSQLTAQANRGQLHQRLLKSTDDLAGALRRRVSSNKSGGYGYGYGHYASSSFMEAFYSLYANIRLMGSDAPIQILTVASASPGDGKSTVSTHLALAAAGMGYRVLLVDADLRWPRLHEKLKIQNLRGFSNLLTNDSLVVTDLLQSHPQEEELRILTAGPIPPDPPRLLSSNRLRHLIDDLKAEFDLVIFDTPPLGHFVDGKLLASVSDGTLMVASLKKTDRNIVRRLVQEFRTSINAPLLGCIANAVQIFGFGRYYNDYYQYYGRQSANPGAS